MSAQYDFNTIPAWAALAGSITHPFSVRISIPAEAAYDLIGLPDRKIRSYQFLFVCPPLRSK